MSNPMCVTALFPARPLHDELAREDEPLSSFLAQSLAAQEAALYEYLTDTPTPGNESQQTAGHAHGRNGHNGVYLHRHGALALGTLCPQTTTSQSFVPASFLRLDLGGPNEDGLETGGDRIAFTRPGFYLWRDYTTLVLNVLGYVEGEGAGAIRLTLYQNGAECATSEIVSCQSAAYTPFALALAIPNHPNSDGYAQVQLDFRAPPNGRLTIAGADALHKPMPGTLDNGLAWLNGDTP